MCVFKIYLNYNKIYVFCNSQHNNNTILFLYSDLYVTSIKYILFCFFILGGFFWLYLSFAICYFYYLYYYGNVFRFFKEFLYIISQAPSSSRNSSPFAVTEPDIEAPLLSVPAQCDEIAQTHPGAVLCPHRAPWRPGCQTPLPPHQVLRG